jgi:hypothetical protein
MSNASIPYDFNCWSVSEKYDYISLYGKYIGVRPYYNYLINLYLVNDSFCELWYFKPENKIEKIELLDDLKKIDLYINYMQELKKS